jgi:hypothetical protein
MHPGQEFVYARGSPLMPTLVFSPLEYSAEKNKRIKIKIKNHRMPLQAEMFVEPSNLRGTAGGACVATARSGSMLLTLQSVYDKN